MSRWGLVSPMAVNIVGASAVPGDFQYVGSSSAVMHTTDAWIVRVEA